MSDDNGALPKHTGQQFSKYHARYNFTFITGPTELNDIGGSSYKGNSTHDSSMGIFGNIGGSRQWMRLDVLKETILAGKIFSYASRIRIR
ncbi:hypothetical protein DL770_008708 [Monosporascus sp. CRB-9-2]|nr:hypothetical protein DL770_008708 [Monosporascus sp. CRB-9-2]